MKATNHYVWVERDKTESEKSGLYIPSTGRKKPHAGVIISIGGLVKDAEIKKAKGKKAIFHETVGQEIEYDSKVYLILEEFHIIGIE